MPACFPSVGACRAQPSPVSRHIIQLQTRGKRRRTRTATRKTHWQWRPLCSIRRATCLTRCHVIFVLALPLHLVACVHVPLIVRSVHRADSRLTMGQIITCPACCYPSAGGQLHRLLYVRVYVSVCTAIHTRKPTRRGGVAASR